MSTHSRLKIIIVINAFIVFISVFLFFSTPALIPAYAALSDKDKKPALTNPQVQTGLTVDTAGQINPEGLRLKSNGYKRRIQETGDDGEPSRYTQSGVRLAVSPAYAMGTIYGEWQPAIFLNLHIEYDLIRYFGAYTGLLSFPNKDSKFGDDEVDNLDGKEESTTGQKLSFQPTFYAKLGPVIISNKMDMAYYLFNGHGPYFLELEYDMLLKNGDYLINNSTSFLVPLLKGKGVSVMYLGPYYEITRAHDAVLTRQRIGGQMYLIIADNKWSMKKPHLYSQASYNIEDRNRKGDIYLALGFGFDFDL